MQWKPILLLASSTFFGFVHPMQVTTEPVAIAETQTIIQSVAPINTTDAHPKGEQASGTEKLLPALVPICACESTGRRDGTPTQFESDGVTVKRGRINSNDIGMCQINIEPRNGHLVEAEKLGFDLFTEQGNIKYANYLYKQQGDAPWEWSASCWRQ